MIRGITLPSSPLQLINGHFSSEYLLTLLEDEKYVQSTLKSIWIFFVVHLALVFNGRKLLASDRRQHLCFNGLTSFLGNGFSLVRCLNLFVFPLPFRIPCSIFELCYSKG